MTAKAASVGTVSLLLLALLGVAVMLIAKGSSAPVATGVCIGAGLGGLNLLIEALSLSYALRRRPSATLAVSLGGFLVRLALVSALTVVFAKSTRVSAVAFALTYVTTFLAFLVVQIWAISRVSRGARSKA
jgi:hypothetical protein